MNILICGFMGAGKTTLLQQLKENTEGYFTFDLDEEIGRVFNDSVANIINQKGLAYFREQEALILGRLLSLRTNKVIALGGGTVEAPGFWELKDQAKLIYLKIPFETCHERIKKDLTRPLALKSQEELKDLYDLRDKLYQRSDLTLDEEKIKGIDSIASLVHNLG